MSVETFTDVTSNNRELQSDELDDDYKHPTLIDDDQVSSDDDDTCHLPDYYKKRII